jgi:hypothetical protein
VLIDTAFHQGGRPRIILLCAGGAVVLLAALSEGSLGALRVLTPRAHRLLDPLLYVALVLSPTAYWRDLSLAPVLVSVASAVLLWRLHVSTRYQPAKTWQAAGAEGPDGGGTGGEPGPAPPPREMQAGQMQAGGAATGGAATGGAATGEAATGEAATGEAASGREPAAEPPSTAWTLGVLAARLRRQHPQTLEVGARRLGGTIGRVAGKRTGEPRRGSPR